MSQQPRLAGTTCGFREAIGLARGEGKRIGLVPTMGALHEGHLSLVRAARAECGFCAVTIYVNPSQFGPRDDYARYPRALEADLEALARAEADLVFAPGDGEVYPPGFSTWVEPPAVAAPLEGRHRPGHFRGVTTIVLKLLNMAGADAAYFGQKDYQQALVIRRMVEDLNVPIAIRVLPTVREADGLAMSSRNRYLTAAERAQAAILWQGLCLARDLVARGERCAAAVVEAVQSLILSVRPARIDYVALVDPETLEPVGEMHEPSLAALAVVIGRTRLIDNVLLEPPAQNGL